MSKFIKKAGFWVRRRSHLPLILVGSLFVVLLFLNDDISISLNTQYQKEINSLTEQIKVCKDSANYYRLQREALIHENADLEKLARERFHMQKQSEDVYILR